MSAPLLIRPQDETLLALTRGGPLKRLTAHIRATHWDQALAAGADPDSRVELSLRAQRLLRSSTRLNLAASLRRVIRRAETGPAIFDPTVPVARAAVLENQAAIQEIAQWLEELSPVDIRGVAQICLLLGDGASPLYPPATGRELEEELERLYEALVPSPGVWMST